MKDLLIEALVLGGGLALALMPAGEARAMDYRAVFTAPPQRIPSDNSVDAPLLGNGDTLVALGGTPDKLRFYINKNDLWVMRAVSGSEPRPLARLELEFPGLKGSSYRVEQDLQQAITTGRFTQAGVTLSLETGMAATENLLWIKLSTEGGALQGRAGLYLPGQDAAATGDVAVVERRFEQDVLVPSGAACALRVVGGGREFTVVPGKPVLVVASVCSRFDGLTAGRFDQPEFRQAAVRRANELGPEEMDRVRAAHVAWWRQFWAKSFVEIPDKVLEQRYYLSHYVLASASRVYDFPPGLFGWITTDTPSWNGDYHLNYNHVAPFYGLYAANHIEQADPCHVPILAALNMGHEWSLKHFGITNGVILPVGIGPKGSIAGAVLHGQKSNSAYCCVPLAMRWYATYDLDFGKQAYPFVRDTARFWEESLALENGRYVIYKDAIHEGSGENVNPILTLGLVKMVMNLALDMSTELSVDADCRAKWTDIRDRMSDYPVCTVRDLPKQFWPKHLPHIDETLNLPIFRYTDKGLPWCGDNTLGIQHIYPAGGIGLDSKPELLQLAHNQIRVMNRWMDFNGMNSFYAAAARVGYDPTVILKEMRNMLGHWALPNGMIRDNPHGMEHQSIVPNAIQEMLLQSHEGVIRLFPCWPKDQGAKFGTLRAHSAFLVSAELKGGIVCGVKILSEKGRDCTIQNPWPGKKVKVVRNAKTAETVEGTRFTVRTSENETMELMAAESAAEQGNLQDAKAKSDQDQTKAVTAGMGDTRTLDLGRGVTMDFVLIRPGSFMMGSENGGDEKPVRKVSIANPFYMAKYEVTQEQWESIMGSNPSNFSSAGGSASGGKGGKNPVEQVSWSDCHEFLAKLKDKASGMDVRLPTEAEWEYACRAGSSTRFCYGNVETWLGDYAWFTGNSGGTTHPVGEKKPNAWGLYDMHGNVWEWCSDWYGTYGSTAETDPVGPSSGSWRVSRGGSWYVDAGSCRSAYRFNYDSGTRYASLGLRVVVVL